MQRSLTFIDLFAGVGGFRRGMEQAGHKCLGFCEWDKYARASYISMHCITDEQRAYLATLDLKKRQKEILKEEYLNGEWCSDDIRTVDARTIPKADVWGFGAPCQDFSIAGKRKGLDGDRSSLVREVFRILEDIPEEDRPEWIIYENVKGMLSSNRGFDFLSIILEMDGRGYDTEWQLLNSKLHGVPQNRERVYTIGHLRRKGCKKIFPIPATDGKNCTSEVKINLIGHRDGYHRNLQTFGSDGITETLSTCEGGGREHHVAIPFKGGFRTGIDESDTASTLLARDYKGIANFNGNMAGYKVCNTSGINQIGHLGEKNRENPARYRVYSEDGCGPCMNCCEGGGLEPHVAVPLKGGYTNGIVETDVASSLLARDYKGVANQDGNLVGVKLENSDVRST